MKPLKRLNTILYPFPQYEAPKLTRLGVFARKLRDYRILRLVSFPETAMPAVDNASEMDIINWLKKRNINPRRGQQGQFLVTALC